MGVSLGMIGPAISAGGALAGLFGGAPASHAQIPPQFTMPGMGMAAGGALQGIGNLQGTYDPVAGNIVGGATTAANNLYNNPYAGMFQQGAGTAAGMGQGAALGAYGLGQGLIGAGTGLFQPANAVMSSAFDPQSALYARTVQQLQDQTRAGQEARGIAMTPYGAGLENQAMSNFNIDWQNQQLQRQISGLGAGVGAYGAGSQIAGAGAGLMAGAPGQYLNASAMPYNAFQNIGQGQLGALGGLSTLAGQAQGMQNLPLQNYLAYLQTGNQAGGVANQNALAQLAQQNQGFQQNQIMGGQLGSALTGLGKGWGPATQQWGFGGGSYGGGWQ
jgi:hypothetical protein